MVVIVILGILAATAIPKFVDLTTEAGNAAASGVAGAIASGTTVNYAAKLANKLSAPVPIVLNGNNAATCTGPVLSAFVSGVTMGTGTVNTANATTFNVGIGTGTCVASPGTAITCGIIGSKGVSQLATIICTGP